MNERDNTPDRAPARLAGGMAPTPLRIPGAVPPEACSAALERLVEAWIMATTINRQAGEAYRMALRIAAVGAPFGAHGQAVEKIIVGMLKRLDQHLATLPDMPRPPAAA